MIALYTVLAVLLILAVLVIVLLSISITYSLECEAGEEYRVAFHVDWIGKLFKVHINWFSDKKMENILYIGGKSIKKGVFADKEEAESEEKPAEENKEEPTAEAKTESQEQVKEETKNGAPMPPKEDLKWLLGRVLSSDFMEALFKMLRSMYNHTKPRKLEIEGNLGTGDPAYTGMLQGLLYSQWPDVWHNVAFDYLESTCKGRFYMSGRIRLMNMAWYGMGFVLSKPMREIIAHMAKAMRKGGV